MHNTQQGDPRKAAAAIEQALLAEHTPLRLQLGADAVDAVRAHAQMLLADRRTGRRRRAPRRSTRAADVARCRAGVAGAP